jgi:hypothetical protein
VWASTRRGDPGTPECDPVSARELTGEDLLEIGVTVMARPPGKRNTGIHLLAGGEKAVDVEAAAELAGAA